MASTLVHKYRSVLGLGFASRIPSAVVRSTATRRPRRTRCTDTGETGLRIELHATSHDGITSSTYVVVRPQEATPQAKTTATTQGAPANDNAPQLQLHSHSQPHPHPHPHSQNHRHVHAKSAGGVTGVGYIALAVVGIVLLLLAIFLLARAWAPPHDQYTPLAFS